MISLTTRIMCLPALNTDLTDKYESIPLEAWWHRIVCEVRFLAGIEQNPAKQVRNKR